MLNEEIKNPAERKQEIKESPEAGAKFESPEQMRQTMLADSAKEAELFNKENADSLAGIEARAQKEGSAIDPEDSSALKGLAGEADKAKTDLESQLTPPPLPQMPPPLPESYLKFVSSQQEVVPPPLPQMPPPLPEKKAATPPPLPKQVYENQSAMKEREIKDAELLDKKDASKELLAAERSELAKELFEQRRLNRERMNQMKERAAALAAEIEGKSDDLEKAQQDYEKLNEERSKEANSLAGRLRGLVSDFSGHIFGKDAQMDKAVNEQMAAVDTLKKDADYLKEELDNLNELLAADSSRKSIKERIGAHYAKADSTAREKFDQAARSLENVIRRNNAFIVHKMEERESLRHNANSNVSEKTTYQDDVDILLSLEPSISASSVTPGEKANLWPGASGFLLGGGQIGEAGATDLGTRAEGIKERGQDKASIEKIDEVVGRRDKESRDSYEMAKSHGMNEVVVNNPEVFGFFQHAAKDEEGKFWAFGLSIKEQSREAQNSSLHAESLRNNLSSYRERFKIASEKGLPLYVMTEDRQVFECLRVNDDGTVEVGKQLTPEEVAVGKAGLPTEKRKEIGEKLLQKEVFRKKESQEEAKDIINKL